MYAGVEHVENSANETCSSATKIVKSRGIKNSQNASTNKGNLSLLPVTEPQPRGPYSHKQPRHNQFTYRRSHRQSSYWTSSSIPPVCARWSTSQGTYNYNDPWFWYSPWMFHEIPYSNSALPKEHNIYDQSWPYLKNYY